MAAIVSVGSPVESAVARLHAVIEKNAKRQTELVEQAIQAVKEGEDVVISRVAPLNDILDRLRDSKAKSVALILAVERAAVELQISALKQVLELHTSTCENQTKLRKEALELSERVIEKLEAKKQHLLTEEKSLDGRIKQLEQEKMARSDALNVAGEAFHVIEDRWDDTPRRITAHFTQWLECLTEKDIDIEYIAADYLPGEGLENPSVAYMLSGFWDKCVEGIADKADIDMESLGKWVWTQEGERVRLYVRIVNKGGK